MTEQAKVPAIRFAGFTDPWEQRQLGELVTTTIGGGTPSTSNPAYWDGEIPWIQSSNVLEDTLFDVDIPKAITQKGLEESAAQIVPENSIAVVTHVGVGKLIYLPFQYSTSQDFISLCGLKGDARYTCYALWKRLQEDLHIVQGSAIKGITKEDLLEKNLPMPSVEEQAQIGVLFSQLDNLITLHQRKYDKLVIFKKSMLEKMFPKDGESVPEIRFAGFTDPWEQRKFGDCFEFLKSNTLSRAGLNGENGTARNVHYGDILIKFGDCLDGERSDLPFITDDTVLPKFAGSILREGDVIFADTAEDEAAGKCVELRKLPKEPTISGLHTIPARPRFFFGTGYLGHYLNSDAYHRQLLPLMQGIKVISVSKAALQDTQVRFPGLSEQAAIGAALSEIDNLITLHQRKLELLQNIKKSLLDKMFV